jgi:sterol desaturase/sphingolipid hydroxylase (fatty acid hydroxylase superfamily)
MLHALFAAIASLAVLVVVFIPMERVFPARAGQRVFRPAFAVDLCFFFGQYLLWSAVAVWVLTSVQGLLHVHTLVPSGVRGWIAAKPLVLQAIVAVVLGDLLVYWFHRACHAFDWLWRFHAVHHSVEHLDWLAAHREHPLDGIFTQLCANLPAIVLGFPVPMLAGFIMFRGMWAIFIHSNVSLPLGPLRVLFGAPELHHWHHARLDRTAHNFANVAPWLDVLFGTYHCPEGEETYELGLTEPWPKGYVAQLLHPFVQRLPERLRMALPRRLTGTDTARFARATIRPEWDSPPGQQT